VTNTGSFEYDDIAGIVGNEPPPSQVKTVTAVDAGNGDGGQVSLSLEETIGDLHFQHDVQTRTQDQAGMAELLAAQVGPLLGWDAEQQRFYAYDTTYRHWVLDGVRSEQMRRYVRALSMNVRLACQREVDQQGWPLLVADGKDDERKEAKEKIASTMAWYRIFSNSGARGVVSALEHTVQKVQGTDFDRDSALLHTLSGTYDVRTGELREARPEDRITNRVDVQYRPELAADGVELEDVAPHFAQLLRRTCAAPGEVTDGVAWDRLAALQRVLGYALHGSNPEKKMFILIGATDIGKNQVLEIVGDVLGSGLACLSLRPNIIVKRRGDRHDADESLLMGKRLAVVNELTSTMRLDEEQVLRLVNPEGSVVGLRKMRQDITNVLATWAMYTTTNELPMANLTPQVVNRLAVLRLSKIPVPKTDQYDVKAAVLGEEREAVFAWLVRWWREWWVARETFGAATGLVITSEMRIELAAYQAENLGVTEMFFAERCEAVPVAMKDLKSPGIFWNAFQAYVKVQHPDESVKYLRRNAFYKALEQLPGVTIVRDQGADGKTRIRGVAGLRLMEKTVEDPLQTTETIMTAYSLE